MTDFKNRDGYNVEVSTIEKVESYEGGGCSITRAEPGWGTFGLSADELDGFEPQVDDVVVVYTRGFSTIRGVVIDGRVLRYITPAQAEAQHEQWSKNLRLEKLERYIEHGDALKERVKKLHPVLQARMARFDAERGQDFWIEDAEYEMAALEGAQALLNKVEELGLINNALGKFKEGEHEAAVQWIDDWWSLNSKEGNYDYKRQMELVPEFGDGHSGFTAGSAKQFAVALLEGVEL